MYELIFPLLQVEAAPNSGPMLAVARNLRTEKDREDRIQKQKYEQKNMVNKILFTLAFISSPHFIKGISFN